MNKPGSSQVSGGKIWDPIRDERDFEWGLPPGTFARLDKRDIFVNTIAFIISVALCFVANIQYLHLLFVKSHSIETHAAKGVFYITNTSIFNKLNWLEIIIALMAPLLVIPTIRSFSKIFTFKFYKRSMDIRFTAQFFTGVIIAISYLLLLNYMFSGVVSPINTYKDESLSNWVKSELSISEARPLESKTGDGVFYKGKENKLYELITVEDNKTTEYRLKLVNK
jgi:hypothetical protein